MKRVVAIIVALTVGLMVSTDIYGAESRIFNIEKAYQYSSTDYNYFLSRLVQKYPNILKSEKIGASTDGKSIMAVQLGTNLKQDSYVSKLHILVEAGTHARENINPAVVLNMIEDYCRDYYSNTAIKEVNIKSELKDSVLHFIILTNPDGHDYAKFGAKSLKHKNISKGLNPNNYKRTKANIKGVDINRNFPDIYFNGKTWVDMFGKMELDQEDKVPSPDGYNGTAPGSEVETQALMGYILKYDFRAGISYHSMGREVIYDRPQLSKEFNAISKKYAEAINKVIGYKVYEPKPLDKLASGFMSHYFNGNTLKPFITIETTNCDQPSTKKYFQTEYKQYKLYLAPIEALDLARKIGYYDYKIYKDGVYVRDIMDKTYGEAMAKKIGGELFNYKGKPKLLDKTKKAGE